MFGRHKKIKCYSLQISRSNLAHTQTGSFLSPREKGLGTTYALKPQVARENQLHNYLQRRYTNQLIVIIKSLQFQDHQFISIFGQY